MEHLQDILKQTPAASSKATTDTSSNTKEEVCPICRGAGFVYPIDADGNPNYSSAQPCECTTSIKNAHRHEMIQRFSNMGNLVNINFDTIDPFGKKASKGTQVKYNNAYKTCFEYAQNTKGWLYIYGPAGSGKTYLAAAIGTKQLELNKYFLFITASDLLDRIHQAVNDANFSYDELFTGICKTPLLIIDDYGIQSDTPWNREKFDQIFNYRINFNLPTVITSSIKSEDLDDRLRNRVEDSSLCTIVELVNSNIAEVLEWKKGFELQKEMSFDNFETNLPNLTIEQKNNLALAKKASMAFAENPETFFTLQGNTGCGKTHLAAAMVNARYAKGLPATFVVVNELLNNLKASFSATTDSNYNKIYEQVKNAPFLVLDDFNSSNSTAWVENELYQLINSRYNAKLPTVITTTQAYQDMEKRIVSRLSDAKNSNTIAILAPDYRSDLSKTSTPSATKQYRKTNR